MLAWNPFDAASAVMFTACSASTKPANIRTNAPTVAKDCFRLRNAPSLIRCSSAHLCHICVMSNYILEWSLSNI